MLVGGRALQTNMEAPFQRGGSFHVSLGEGTKNGQTPSAARSRQVLLLDDASRPEPEKFSQRHGDFLLGRNVSEGLTRSPSSSLLTPFLVGRVPLLKSTS